jgi:hypothetical protein
MLDIILQFWALLEVDNDTLSNIPSPLAYIGPCHVSGIFLPLRVNSLPLATIYEVKIPLQKWKISLLQRNPAQMTWAIVFHTCIILGPARLG